MDGHALQIRIIASGSSGNALFLQCSGTRILVDTGVSRRRIVRALAEIDIALESLDAILITHDHSDHISGLQKVHERARHVPVYATRGTARVWQHKKGWDIDYQPVTAGWAFDVDDVRVLPFGLEHDAAEPVGYRLETNETAVAIATDLGRPTPEVEHAIRDVQCLLLEANHDEVMLAEGPYPWFLKRRVGSRRGHLSNAQAGQLLERVITPRLEHVVLGHLSDKNNDPQRALDATARAVDGTETRVTTAARKTPGPLMTFLASTPLMNQPAPPRPPRQGELPFGW